MNLLHYISLVGMSDNRMMPTVRPFRMVSIDPITSWPIIMPDSSTKKLPVLIVMCRQTGFTWYKMLLDWTTKSMTLALLIVQYRFGQIQSIVSDKGTNLIPANINPSIKMDKEERRLMSLVHTQMPVGDQHANLVETCPITRQVNTSTNLPTKNYFRFKK